jgi:hypothetical protein
MIWSPIHFNLTKALRSNEALSAIISPFIKVDALERLLELPYTDDLAVIARWQPEEILRGVSDLEIYPLLKGRSIPLYIHGSIHLKLLLFDSDRVFCSSANITSNGLGLRGPANTEAGTLVSMLFDDFISLKRIRDNSLLVTDEIYEAYRHCVDNAVLRESTIPDLDLPKTPDQRYLLSMLPASENPQTLLSHYLAPEDSSHNKDHRHRIIHDLCTYNLPAGLPAEAVNEQLRDGFRKNPFIQEIVERIKDEGSLRFGAVNNFIHSTCRDVPLPYRWEIKSTTANLYNWLACYYSEITWDRPQHSQVIYWNDSS